MTSRRPRRLLLALLALLVLLALAGAGTLALTVGAHHAVAATAAAGDQPTPSDKFDSASWHGGLVVALVAGVLSLTVWAPRRRWTLTATALREVAIVVGLFAVWQLARVYALTKVDGGIANGEAVWRAERALWLPSEATVQRAFLPHPWLVRAADRYYLYPHFMAMAVLLVWLFVRRREGYFRWRTTLVLVTAACLAVQFIPVAPPRFLPHHGLVDTAVVYGESVYGDMRTGIADQLSAMPSVHFAWAALIAAAVLSLSRSRWRWLVLVHPALTLWSIVVTANHYWLDAAAGGALLAAAYAVELRLERSRAQAVEVAPAPLLE